MMTTKCPVCDWDVQEGGIKVSVGGQEIVVCCDECAMEAQEGLQASAEQS